MLKSNPNFYHTLHEQVALGYNDKEQEESEKETGIDELRRKLITPHAHGLVLETCIGTNMNRRFYQDSKITKIIGLDWVKSSIQKANQKVINPKKMSVLNCDIHKTPFSDDSFDTVVDTFGLECCYDVDQAYKEMKRVTKKGGKILLLERGNAIWLGDKFELMRRATLNLGARGQVYHFNFDNMI